MRNLFFLVAASLSFCVSSQIFADSKTETVLWDGLESQDRWNIADWSDKGEISLSSEHASQGLNCLKVVFDSQGKKNPSKGIVLEKEQVALDINSTQKLIIDVYNDGSPLELALVLYSNEFCESSKKIINSGLNKDVVFDFRANDFKSPASSWNYNYSLTPGSVAWVAMLIIYPGSVDDLGAVYLDNIRLERFPRVSSEQRVIPVEDYLPPKIISVQSAGDKIKQYEKFEITVDFDGTYQYPYNPKDIDLSAVFIPLEKITDSQTDGGFQSEDDPFFTPEAYQPHAEVEMSPSAQTVKGRSSLTGFISPSGKKNVVAGFLYSGEVDGVNIKDAVWKIRFAPPEAGKWAYYVEVKNLKGLDKSGLFEFECLPSDANGFVRVSKKDPLYFEFDNGKFYYPIGQNVAWASSLEAYNRYFSKMKENGYNWSRVWMSSWQCAIEWLDVGDFHGLNSYNLKAAKLLDDITDLAARYGIYYQLVLNQHGQLSTKDDPEWLNNPYNAKNGGPCAKPTDFFTDKLAKELFKYRMRYITARWGYSANIMAWELWNELTLTDNYSAELDIPWQKEMAGYIKSIDPNRHMVTTSYFGNFPKEVWELPELDYAQIHMYTAEMLTTLDGFYILMKDYNKPYFVGEFGASNLSGIDRSDPNATLQHAGIWAQYMTPSAGNAMPWEWDDYIDPLNLYYHWQALAKFNEGEERRNMNLRYSRATIECDDGAVLMAQGILNDSRALIWIYDLDRMKFDQGPLKPLDAKDVILTIAGMNDGKYKAEFWDTYKGIITGASEGECINSEVKVALPRITKDIACKVIAQDKTSFPALSGESSHASLDYPIDPPIKSGEGNDEFAVVTYKTAYKNSSSVTEEPHIVSRILDKEVELAPRDLWEGFETQDGWQVADWSDKADILLSSERVTEGKKSLKVVFDKAGRRMDGKGIAVDRRDISLDLSKAKDMIFDVYLDAPNSIELSVVVNSKSFCESPRRIILPGWNKNVTFDLTASNFKRESTRWQHKGKVDRFEPIEEVTFMIYPWDIEKGAVYIDNVGFLRISAL